MSKNQTAIKVNEHGGLALQCECGNTESITEANPTYKTFGYWINSAKKVGEGFCKQCNSEVHEIRSAPDALAVATAHAASILKKTNLIALQLRLDDVSKLPKIGFVAEPESNGVYGTTMSNAQWDRCKYELTGVPYKLDLGGDGTTYQAFNGADW